MNNCICGWGRFVVERVVIHPRNYVCVWIEVGGGQFGKPWVFMLGNITRRLIVSNQVSIKQQSDH